MKKIFLYLTIIFLISSCTSKKVVFTVENLKDVKNYKENPLIYSLPKTVISIDVEVTKKVYKKGPFSDFADTKLGITDVISKDKVEWTISNVEFQTFAKIDTTQIYVINSNNPNFSNFVNLSKEGFLISFNKAVGTYYSDIEVDDNMVVDDELETSLSYSDVAIKKNYKEIYDTSYNEVAEDTSFIKVPIVKTQTIQKTVAEQAEELAEQIFRLRDDRSALLVGEGDGNNLPEGKALETMLKNLDNLEEQYLSMFIGKTFTTKQNYHFEYIPSDNQIFRQEILFKFSDSEGYFPATSLKGKPVFLEIESEIYTSVFNNFNNNQTLIKRVEKIKNQNSGVVYRIPEKTKIKLKYLDKEINSEDILISQYGVNMRLPVYLFYNTDYSIEFYPKYGALKSIEKK